MNGLHLLGLLCDYVILGRASPVRIVRS